MATFQGNTSVAPGLYFNVRELRFVSMDDGGILPGEAKDTYRAVHPLALLLVGPVVGLVYAIFLPLIAFVMIGAVIVRKLAESVEHLLGRRPALAHAAAGNAKATGAAPAARVDHDDRT